jgi:hypothetical protein
MGSWGAKPEKKLIIDVNKTVKPMKKIEIGMEKEITELMPAAKKGTGPGF